MTSNTTHTLGSTPPMPRLIDSHCHLHDSEFYDDAAREAAYQQAVQAGIAMICVGTDVRSSRQAVQFALAHDHCYVAVGIHPHDAEAAGEAGIAAIRELLAEKPLRQGRPVIVGVGEIGLDYFYDNSARPAQQQCLQAQLQLAAEFQLPVSFHVRDEKQAHGAVWQDFWPIYDAQPVRGVLHSFTDTQAQLEQSRARGLFIGVNGISTFTKDSAQQQLYTDLPLDAMLLETDAPFLTPVPFRGRINLPAYVEEVARDQAAKKGLPVARIATTTTANVQRLFDI